MRNPLKFASFATLVLCVITGARCASDFRYCSNYPYGRCADISVSTTASTCFPFDMVNIGPVNVVSGLTSGITYILYTAATCSGTASPVYGPGLNYLGYPFVNNVQSVSIQVPVTPPFKPQGCYTDTAGGRILNALSDATNNLTVESCQAFCSANGYTYAGVEYGRECYCDYSIRPPGVLANSTTCNVSCSGNAKEICGGSNRINISWNGKPGPTNPPTIGSGTFLYRGCYTDNVNNTRSLPAHYDIPGGATPESCASTCKSNNFTIIGLEYGLECWCGNVLSHTSTKVTEDNCRMACKANPVNWCGDSSRLSVWSSKSL